MQMGKVPVPGHDMYIVNDPEAVRKVLVEESGNYPKHRFMQDLLRPLVGDSVFTSNGETWRSQRRLMEPAFDQARIDHVFPLMADAAATLMARLAVLPDGAICDIETEMTHFTADVIFRTIFSEPLPAEDAARIFSAFGEYQRAAPKVTMRKYRPGLAGWWTRRRDAGAAARSAGEIRGLLKRLVEVRYNAAGDDAAAQRTDILASLLQARKAGTGLALGVDELVDEIAVLFLAGHETSASALAWAFHFLAHSPDVQERMHLEVQALMGEGKPDLEGLQALELTRRVFRETLRLYPPLGFLVREAAGEGCLRDKTISPGAAVVISPWLIQRHGMYWERPDEFDPDRFLTESGRASASKAFLPFSIGPRVCVGAGFAMQEAVLALAMLVRQFRICAVDGRQPMPVARLSLRSDIGIKVKLERRHR